MEPNNQQPNNLPNNPVQPTNDNNAPVGFAGGTPVANPSPPTQPFQPTAPLPTNQVTGPQFTPTPSQIPVPNGNTSSSKSSLFIILVVVVLLVVGAGLFFILMHKPKTTKSNGSKVASSQTCTTETCFAPKFASCTPATLNVTNPFGSAHYQINGPKNSACNMLFEYTANPNPAWQNKPMTCDFNNKKALDSSVQDVLNNVLAKSNTYSCTGPLVAILQSQ